MLIYKFDVLRALKNMGYNTTRIREERLIGESALQSIRDNKMVSAKTLDTLCELLNLQPGDIIGYKTDEEAAKKQFRHREDFDIWVNNQEKAELEKLDKETAFNKVLNCEDILSIDDLVCRLKEEGYDLNDLTLDGEQCSIGGYTNNGWFWEDEINGIDLANWKDGHEPKLNGKIRALNGKLLYSPEKAPLRKM